MAQTGFTPISIYYSATATNVPTAGNLVAGELAINTADGKLFYKDSSGVVQVIGTKGGVGSSTTTQVLYNSSGLVVGSANMTFSGTALTLANDASISGLTVGKGVNAVSQNTAIGYQALNSGSLSGNFNVALGYQALLANTTGTFNHGLGRLALSANTTGAQNVAVGNASLSKNTTGSFNIGIGSATLVENLTTSNNVAIGQNSMNKNVADNNTAVGAFTLDANTTGTENSAFGNFSLTNSTTGSYNTALGSGSLQSNTTASNNTAVGYQALYSNTTPAASVAFGNQAGYSSTTGGNNVSVGNQALYANTTGFNNTSVGNSSGATVTTGNNNTYIGNAANASSSSSSQEIVINASSSAIVGKGTSTGFISPNGGGVYQGNNSAAWSITSDARLKKNIVDNKTGLDKITAIQVRNFEYRTTDEITDLPKEQVINVQGIQLGAIAQELQAILPDCVKTESTGVMSVDTTNLTWYLINAVKELNAKITALENK